MFRGQDDEGDECNSRLEEAMADSATAGEAFACALKWAEEDEDSVRQAALCARWAQELDDVDPHSALDLRIRRARLLGDAHVQVAHNIEFWLSLVDSEAHQVEANGHLVSLGMLEGRDRLVTAALKRLLEREPPQETRIELLYHLLEFADTDALTHEDVDSARRALFELQPDDWDNTLRLCGGLVDRESAEPILARVAERIEPGLPSTVLRALKELAQVHEEPVLDEQLLTLLYRRGEATLPEALAMAEIFVGRSEFGEAARIYESRFESAGEWDDWQRWLNTQIALELDEGISLVAHRGLNRFLIEEKRLSECLEGLRERRGVEYLIQVCDDFAEQLEPEERKLSFVLRTADLCLSLTSAGITGGCGG